MASPRRDRAAARNSRLREAGQAGVATTGRAGVSFLHADTHRRVRMRSEEVWGVRLGAAAASWSASCLVWADSQPSPALEPGRVRMLRFHCVWLAGLSLATATSFGVWHRAAKPLPVPTAKAAMSPEEWRYFQTQAPHWRAFALKR